ncbi:hypothetical protein M378DRAFT_174271 [Amanita muscaria Koide BX008]|uniref:Uncharacterized protein n=1 Tax=Amanita muscaria (strain Koide BX008) TaxID=946122 RepID=A0A0C2WCS7_AMAMK|nr:hypothetical protein M378DRAFT_174271 [Amanita muscaria Koide BX008]
MSSRDPVEDTPSPSSIRTCVLHPHRYRFAPLNLVAGAVMGKRMRMLDHRWSTWIIEQFLTPAAGKKR